MASRSPSGASSDEISVVNKDKDEEETATSTTPGPSTETSTGSSTPQKCSGYWGEKCTDTSRDAVNVEEGVHEFENLRLELTRTRTTRHPEAPELNKEADLIDFLMHAQQQDEQFGRPGKKLGVAYKGLTVKGIDSQRSFVKTFPDAILGSLGPDLWRFVQTWILRRNPEKGAPLRTLIHEFCGVVRGGEMVLVLGKPGSGCSTFLRAITNQRASFAEVTGAVHYGGISSDETLKHYRAEIVYSEEDDIHFPLLTVRQTLFFALLNKIRRREWPLALEVMEVMGRVFGIGKVFDTIVGNGFIRGVSGGERKRVSIVETLATAASVTAWDNSTRGLDASTAVEYVRSLRIITDTLKRTTFVTLYQAGEGIYNLMDKILLIDEGRMIYSGPANAAKAYFIDLGFECPPRQTTADFLTAVTDPIERRFRPGWELKAPKTSEELERAFKSSNLYIQIMDEVTAFERELKESDSLDARNFKDSVAHQKSKHVSGRSNYTVSFVRQVAACSRREFWLLKGNLSAIYTKTLINLGVALVLGSLFYNTPDNTEGMFSRGGVLTISLLFNSWLQMSELFVALQGRSVVMRHRDLAFYRPSAVVIARAILDIPLIFLQTTVFSLVVYFLAQLSRTGGQFFIYFIFVYLCIYAMTQLYRMFAAWLGTFDDALRFVGLAILIMFFYTGYIVSKVALIADSPWFGWFYYTNPLAYAFEAVMANEFEGQNFVCAPSQLIPSGPGYTNSAFQSCDIIGATPGSTVVSGGAYIEQAFGFSRSHIWRNFGFMFIFIIAYILLGAFGSEYRSFGASGAATLQFKKTKQAKGEKTPVPDIENQRAQSLGTVVVEDEKKEDGGQKDISLSTGDSIFTWSDLSYEIPYGDGTRKLLNNLWGWCKPGELTALMGASGAGKTTLLNTLSQRQTVGVITGAMLVDGKQLGLEFRRGTGFCLQQDIHDETGTIREALEFSALLRQDRSIPDSDKLAYVDEIVKLLELGPYQDAIVRSLNVDLKKRLTLGVELAAKPSLLLFLDEPTSGLDSQSAWNIVRFLRRLANLGQAVLCTIHQPSSLLIEQFDRVFALAPGGHCYYFGPLGHNCEEVVKYFAARGAYCPPTTNVAEFLLDAGVGNVRAHHHRVDWVKLWAESPEFEAIKGEVTSIVDTRAKLGPSGPQHKHEFAASTWTQTRLLTKRMWINYWRSPSYGYGNLFSVLSTAIAAGFTFWKLGNSQLDLQERMFAAFMFIFLPAPMMNAVLPKFFEARMLWESRELPSRVYGWFAFSTANILCEIPYAILFAVIYFVTWYYPVGFPYDSSTAGYVFFIILVYFLFIPSWAQWIAAFARDYTIVANILPFFLVMTLLISGVIIPYAQINVFWRYTMYYISPITYLIGGVLSAVLNNIPVVCTPSELITFNPPSGQTCAAYATDYLNSALGYLVNGNATIDCQYCSLSNSDGYLATLNIYPDNKWRDFGILLGFTVSNWILVYVMVYVFRYKGWSYMAKFQAMWDRVMGLFSRKH